MPIGLAASLFIITPQASIIPWILTIIMLPYMVIISDVTRKWVANSTIIAAGASFFLQSYLNSDGFYYDNFDTLLILALLVTGEIGRLKGKIDDFAHFALLGLLVLSSPVLLGSGPSPKEPRRKICFRSNFGSFHFDVIICSTVLCW